MIDLYTMKATFT